MNIMSLDRIILLSMLDHYSRGIAESQFIARMLTLFPRYFNNSKQVYYYLGTFEKEKWITATYLPHTLPAQKWITITSKGRTEWIQHLPTLHAITKTQGKDTAITPSPQSGSESLSSSDPLGSTTWEFSQDEIATMEETVCLLLDEIPWTAAPTLGEQKKQKLQSLSRRIVEKVISMTGFTIEKMIEKF